MTKFAISNFEKILAEGNSLSIQTMAQSVREECINYWRLKSYDALETEVRIMTQKVARLKPYKLEENLAAYVVGMVDATAEIFKELLRDSGQCAEIQDTLTPRCEQVLRCLYDNVSFWGGVRHGELADRLDMSDSALSNLMKKILKSGAAEARKTGKNTYYSITNAGKQYCKERALIKAKGPIIERGDSVRIKDNNKWISDGVVEFITDIDNQKVVGLTQANEQKEPPVLSRYSL